MRLLAALTLCLFVAGCGKKKDEKDVDVDLTELRAKAADYQKWSNDFLASQEHWVTDGCDDTLKTGLRGLYDDAVDLTLAIRAPGEWTRRRVASGDCYDMRDEKGERLSKSRSSRDMVVGEMAWMLRRDRRDLARDLIAYADAHGETIGDGDSSRTLLTPQLYATLAKLAGRKVLDVPLVVGGEQGFERHVAAWHMIVRADLDGGLAQSYHSWIRQNAESQPENPLHQWMLAAYVTGSFKQLVDVMMDERYWPRDHLPTSANFCDDWVIQRDMGDDWQACKDPATVQWSGSDWLAVAYLLLR